MDERRRLSFSFDAITGTVLRGNVYCEFGDDMEERDSDTPAPEYASQIWIWGETEDGLLDVDLIVENFCGGEDLWLSLTDVLSVIKNAEPSDIVLAPKVAKKLKDMGL